MNAKIMRQNGVSVAVLQSETPLITNVQSALDLAMTARYETGCDRVALNKGAVCEDFFVLSTRLAGEVLQKFINYQIKFAIYGDFSGYTSKPLRDFIRESNRGHDIFFTETAEQAVDRLSAV
ncbi:MAG: DUF4180 domain-containing protein [Eubacteriales bacterium]|nr:DUF4180 domain-containing protein [Eubacteriales bacterium]